MPPSASWHCAEATNWKAGSCTLHHRRSSSAPFAPMHLNTASGKQTQGRLRTGAQDQGAASCLRRPVGRRDHQVGDCPLADRAGRGTLLETVEQESLAGGSVADLLRGDRQREDHTESRRRDQTEDRKQRQGALPLRFRGAGPAPGDRSPFSFSPESG